MSKEPVIRVEGLWKRYGLPLRPYLNEQLDKLRGRHNSDPVVVLPLLSLLLVCR